MYLFTSESVSPGHPDKCADIISDTVLQDVLEHDKESRVAAETFVAGKNIVIGGEIKTSYEPDYKMLVLKALNFIGYKDVSKFSDTEVLKPKNVNIETFINRQSPDISQGVDQETGEIGAGDQGMMFGYASCETPEFMPSAIQYAKQLMQYIYNFAKNDDTLGIDIKTQVTVDYGNKTNFDNCNPQKIHTIIVSVPCVNTLDIETLRMKIRCLICTAGLPEKLFDINKCKILINPTGRYVNHSSLHDSGLTGRKLIVDSFGGYSPIGGGAQSGKDYTKVDRSGLYAARWIAKNLVNAGHCKKCSVQLSYAIGVSKPISINVNTEGTYITMNDDMLSKMVQERFPCSVQWIIDKFQLKDTIVNPYRDIAARGQVGESDYSWEKLEPELFRL